MKNKILLIIFSFFTFFLYFDNVNALVALDSRNAILKYEDATSYYSGRGSYECYNPFEFIDLIIDSYNANKTENSPELFIYLSRTTTSPSTITALLVTDDNILLRYGDRATTGNTFSFTVYANLAYSASNSRYVFTGSSTLCDDSNGNLSKLNTFVNNLNNSFSTRYDIISTSRLSVTNGVGGYLMYQVGIPVYYSGNSSKIIYDLSDELKESTSTTYYLNINYNDEYEISLGDHFPTYYEYLGLSDPPTEEPDLPEPDDVPIQKYTNNYYGFMLSQIPVSNIYDYNVRFTVGQRLIYSDINYQFNLFGRINHGTYFTYEPISCTVGTSNEEPYFGSENFLDSFNVYQSKTFGIMDCSSDLTKYDYVYVNAFNENFDDNDITYFGYTSNYGYVNVNDFIANPTKVVDYFNFTKTSNMFVTSKCSSCGLYLGFDLTNFLYSFYDLSNFKRKDYLVSTTINSSFLKFYRFENIGLETNQGFGINLYSNYDSGTLYLLADSDILVSFDSDISSNNNFTYFDFSGNVVNNIFEVYYIYDSNVGTNVNTYFGIVSTYIDSISNDIKSISNVFQHVYDLAPEILQTLILVFYILAMSYILFKIIRK